MGLKVGIQMDPIEAVNIETDSTFVLALEARNRGHTLFHYLPDTLSFSSDGLFARGHPLEVRATPGDHFTKGDTETINLADLDVILMRQDPPFDMAYITATHLLERIHPKTLVVNDPAHVRNAPEKLFVTDFPDLMPPTLITADLARILQFRDQHRDIIVKPLYGNGGAGVFHIKPGDENLTVLMEMFAGLFREPVVVQAYLKEVREGDKRVILIDGEPAGALTRIPPEGEVRSNLHVGGSAKRIGLTDRDHEICAAIGPELRARGLLFTGIDIIGGYLTEINVTSPTGLQEINRFDGVSLESQIWDAIDARLSSS